MTGYAARVPAGVYRGAVPDIAPVQAYEAFLGMPAGMTVNYVLAFMADSPATWFQFEQAVLQSSTGGPPGSHIAAEWAPLLGNRVLMLAVPACCLGATWADEASGATGVHWAALARNLASAGLGNCVLRIAREFNGSWYRWQVTQATASEHKAGWAQIRAALRDGGFTGPLMWNPSLGQGTFGPSYGAENAYPGDSLVDVIGVDVYDGNWSGIYPSAPDLVTTASQQQVWDQMLTEWDGLRGWYNLARAHRKPLAFPEWGLRGWKDAGTWHSGGDNAVLVSEMARTVAGLTIPGQPPGAWMHAMWEDPGMGVSDPDYDQHRLFAVPRARAVFLTAFSRAEALRTGDREIILPHPAQELLPGTGAPGQDRTARILAVADADYCHARNIEGPGFRAVAVVHAVTACAPSGRLRAVPVAHAVTALTPVHGHFLLVTHPAGYHRNIFP